MLFIAAPGPVYKNSGLPTIQQIDKERISSLVRLRAAVQKGIDDSEAGRFTMLDSAAALSGHLAGLRATEKPGALDMLLP